MPIIQSTLDASSDQFQANHRFMLNYLQKVRDIEARIRAAEESYRPRAQKRGKLLPRERLAHLLDPGTPFIEFSSIGGYRMYEDEDGSSAGGNLICGIGYVSGRRVAILVWNYAIKGGTINGVTTRKHLRLQEICFQSRLPTISLSESGGGDLAGSGRGPQDPWGAAGFLDGGRVYCQQAELSAAGCPQIIVAHGNATAGGAYHVGLSDYIVLVRGKSQFFLAGPPLLKAATGEIATAEALGGAEMHASRSGTGEYLSEDDADGVRVAREIVAQLPRDPRPERDAAIEPPLYPEEELLGIVPEDKRIPFDIREVIARIVDGSRFLEFQPDIDPYMVCGHAYLQGWRIGILGNNGPITPNGAKKAAQFIQLCDQSRTPLLFLHNTTGFLVGVEVEEGGQVKHGSKMIQAVANTRSFKISIGVGNSYGAGNYAMCSRALKPHFIFSWPTSRVAVMGGAQARKVIEIVTEDKLLASGVALDDKMRALLDQQGEKIEAGLESVSESIYCSARIMDDGLIDPRDTRQVIGFCLDTLFEGQARQVAPSSFGVQRL